MMRSEKLWLEAVPELATYEYLKIKNPRNPTISANNLGVDSYAQILMALGAKNSF